jgi:hypothetical protein
MLLRLKHDIPHHLHCFRVLEHNVLSLNRGLHEVLVDYFAEAAPEITVVHDEEMIAASNQVVADV